MTDDLIARLRYDDDSWNIPDSELADALKAQARRIAELEEKLADEEYVSKDTNEMFHEVRDENIELRVRIAELEATLVKVGYDFTLSRDELAVIAREELRLK